MNWEQLLSLKRQGDTLKRLRLEQDETRIGFEVDYDRIIFSSSFIYCRSTNLFDRITRSVINVVSSRIN